MGRQHGELKGRLPSKAYTRLPQTSIVGATVQFPTEGLMRLLAPAWTAPQQSSRGENKVNGTSPSPSFYTLVLFSTPNVQLARPKSGGRPDGVGLALLLKADDLGGAAIKMIDLRVRCRRAL